MNIHRIKFRYESEEEPSIYDLKAYQEAQDLPVDKHGFFNHTIEYSSSEGCWIATWELNLFD